MTNFNQNQILMKKLIVLFVLFFNAVYSQNIEGINISTSNSTSQDEYNFISNNGLKRFMEEGGDMKLNYRLVKFFTQNIEDKYDFEYYSFFKTEGDQKGFKAIAVIIKSRITKKNFYICIPLNNNSLYDKHWQTILSYGDDLAKAYSYSTGVAMCKLSSFNYNKQ